MKNIKIGVMPGRIQEFAVENGTTIAQAIEIAGLDVTGYEVKVDGNTERDLDATVETANIILLVKVVKGNSDTVKIGVMPGRIQEYAFEEGTTVEEAIEQAGLSTTGYDVKIDGTTVTDLSTPIADAGIVLLVKVVKGNAGTIKIGVMPGRIQEYAFESGTTVADAIEQAGLDTKGYDVKIDGVTVTDLDVPVDEAGIILLVKVVKGN